MEPTLSWAITDGWGSGHVPRPFVRHRQKTNQGIKLLDRFRQSAVYKMRHIYIFIVVFGNIVTQICSTSIDPNTISNDVNTYVCRKGDCMRLDSIDEYSENLLV